MKQKKLNLLKICLLAIFAVCLSAGLVACSYSNGGNQSGSNGEQPSGERKKYTVHFETNTEYQTNAVLDQLVKEGMHAKKPTVKITDENVSDLVVFGWYTEADCVNEWNFRKRIITEDITLYAKWGFEYTVNYYVVDETTSANATLTPVYTDTLREGSYAEEYTEYAVGFDYLGSFTDRDCTIPFDYSQELSASTDIYIKKSASINFYEGSASGSLSENLNAVAAGSYIDSENPENNIVSSAGWAESVTINGNEYTYVNFGYSPYNPDPYVEIDLPLDIRNSQTLTFTFKNLGKSSLFSIYYTTYADESHSVYSLTGKYYTGTFSKSKTLNNDQRNMDENDDEWIEVTFDLTEMTTAQLAASNGYSVWGTSPYLAGLRIQSNYKSTDESDYSNAYIIKSITGGKKEVSVTDSEIISDVTANSSDKDLASKSESQESVKGFVFPKNFASASVSDYGTLYNREEGLVLYTENEIALRNTDYKKTVLTLDYSGEDFDLAENCTLNLRLKNLGYCDNISFKLYNTDGLLVSGALDVEKEMTSFQNYFVNLSSSRYMKDTLDYIEIEYESVGVNNALVIESLYFSKYRPNDIAGINFIDKYNFGFTSSDKIEVSYNDTLKGTTFNVLEAGSDRLKVENCNFTNDGYVGATLKYYVSEATKITAVQIGYQIGLSQKFYTHPVDNEKISGKICESYVAFEPEDRGKIVGVSISFYGSGKITISAVEFELSKENSVDYTQNMSFFYSRYDWVGNCKYVYDTSTESSKLTAANGKLSNFRTYPGYMAEEMKSSTWTPAQNISLKGKTVIKLIYQNQTDFDHFDITLGLDDGIYGTGEKSSYTYSGTLQTGMDDYEWAVLTINLADNAAAAEFLAAPENADVMLAKTLMNFYGTLRIRALVVE